MENEKQKEEKRKKTKTLEERDELRQGGLEQNAVNCLCKYAESQGKKIVSVQTKFI